MTATETAELAPDPARGHLAVRVERRRERRRRQWLAFCGIAALVVLLALTVIVVDVVR
ncbi:MAG: hypothetical protein ACRDY3_12185 [Acidimicrobiales bacterium]